MAPTVVAPGHASHALAMSRPQVGIERLPTRRLSTEPRESMNCKSCRKRKIKCNRLRPACEACQVFQCACVYDAIPKKRGPKTDVLEALLKRVDGLEQKLKDSKKSDAPLSAPLPATEAGSSAGDADALSSTSLSMRRSASASEHKSQREPQPAPASAGAGDSAAAEPSPLLHTSSSESSAVVQPEALLDTYFSRFHGKPFHILDESSVRQRLRLQQLPRHLVHAIFAVAARYTPHPSGYQSAVRLSEELAARSRAEIDTDEPSLDALRTLLLLVTAFIAAGKGKKAFMLMASAVGMAMALELHRELDVSELVTAAEREARRRLFWCCYLLDRFLACGSKRASLVADRAILLRLPSSTPDLGPPVTEGAFFSHTSNLQFVPGGGGGGGGGETSPGSSGVLIDICRILGVTNRYLAAGGVKGDSHFPWHALSNLSRIRHDLDVWASSTDEVFSGLFPLFDRADSTVLVLSKLIYHLIHCLIYRPFLPVDLAELAGAGQHQSWQIEATNMCFLHANAIAELVDMGRQAATIEWPAFVGYCICTAGTVHVHGAYYNSRNANRDGPGGGASSSSSGGASSSSSGGGGGGGSGGGGGVFAASADFLSREMQQLSELRYAWASVQHQRETLQAIYSAHAELVKSISGNGAANYPAAFQLEDFFDRYANIGGLGGRTFRFDAASLSLSDVVVDFTADAYTGHDLYAPRADGGRKRLNSLGSAPMRALSENKLPPLVTAPSLPSAPMSLMGFAAVSGPGGGSPGLRPPFAALASPYPFATMGGGLTGSATGAAAQQSGDAPIGPPSYDPMIGELTTNAFSSPAPWQTADVAQAESAAVATATSGMSRDGRPVGSAQPTDDKDPFLSLLEQLAENDLDFFLASGSSSTGA